MRNKTPKRRVKAKLRTIRIDLGAVSRSTSPGQESRPTMPGAGLTEAVEALCRAVPGGAGGAHDLGVRQWRGAGLAVEGPLTPVTLALPYLKALPGD